MPRTLVNRYQHSEEPAEIKPVLKMEATHSLKPTLKMEKPTKLHNATFQRAVIMMFKSQGSSLYAYASYRSHVLRTWIKSYNTLYIR
jgi:hypothetical protein